MVMLILCLLHPRIGVRDEDAYAYIVGAYSLQATHAYTDLFGDPLNHWPPGYSLVLSCFSSPLSAALVLNYVALVFASWLLFHLAKRSQWDTREALGLAVALTLGFLGGLATDATPDALAYCLLLCGAALCLRRGPASRLTAYFVWSILIYFKLIAVAFVPALLLVDLAERRKSRHIRDFLVPIIGTAFWSVMLAALLLFNYRAAGSMIPPSHGKASLLSIRRALWQLLHSIPRELIAHWYGSIRQPLVLAPFAVVLALAIAAFITLRPHPGRERLRTIGVMILAVSGMMQLLRQFDGDARLMGYGLILIIIAHRPKSGSVGRWLIYGAASLVLFVANGIATNCAGANDLRYNRLASAVAKAGLPAGNIYSNSFYLLDLHIKRASRPATQLSSISDGACFLFVSLPRYDAISSTVWAVESPGDGWWRIWAIDGASLFRRNGHGRSRATRSVEGSSQASR
jgi:hypothetical protein